VQPLIAWLVARPQNAVIALAATLLLPLLQIVSGIVMVLLVLRQGLLLATVEGLIAGALVALVNAAAGMPVAAVITNVAIVWLPAVVLAAILQRTQSLTLTLQVTVLLAALATAGFYFVVPDPTAWWQHVLEVWSKIAREANLPAQTDFMKSNPAMMANRMTMAAVLFFWMLFTVNMLFGYRMYTDLPGESRNFGRFRDLNFGRVLAVLMALTVLLATLTGAAWLQSTAFVLFAVFWLQGLAIVHWLYAAGVVPLFVVIATYALLPVLNVIWVLALAVLGYTDTWFEYRQRLAMRR
jgi:hypothetical protein